MLAGRERRAGGAAGRPLTSDAPRTPTPFKRALAAVYKRSEPLSNTPQTPTKLVEDLTEIIKKENSFATGMVSFAAKYYETNY